MFLVFSRIEFELVAVSSPFYDENIVIASQRFQKQSQNLKSTQSGSEQTKR